MFSSRAPVLLCFLALLLLCSPSVVRAQWEPDVRLTYNDSFSTITSSRSARNVAAGQGNDVYTIWYDYRDGNGEVYFKRSTDGGTSWNPDQRLTNNPDTSQHPSLAVSGASIHVAWMDRRDGNFEIYYQCSTDRGTTWGPETRLTRDPFQSWGPAISVSGATVHIAWGDEQDQQYGIFYIRSTDGGATWTPNIRLNQSDGWPGPALAASQTDLHVAWMVLWGIGYQRSTDGGTTWSRDTMLVQSPVGAGFPSVDAQGPEVHLAWQDARDGNPEIYYKRSSDRGATWSSDIRLTFDTSYTGIPSVTASGNNVHIVWWDGRDANLEIYYKRSTDGGASWDSDTRLTYGANASIYPSTAVSGSTVHLVWADGRDGNREIYYKRNPTGNSGVEGSTSSAPISHFPFSICPNPFVSFATVPGHSSESFTLYDISGRRVGTYRGDRIGEGLRAGVYFLRAEGKSAKPLRVVKVR